jgi:competence ComEA-like helix-hairpin-helix protein
MTNKIRINTANPQELLEIPGIDKTQAEAIVRFRSEHGPIRDASQLASILGNRPVETLAQRLDFSPSTPTAAEAPGA